MPKAQTERRRHRRIRLPEENLLSCQAVGQSLSGQVSILGPGGMFIRTRNVPPVGTTLPVRVWSGEESFEAECVVRDVTPGGIGVEFTRGQGPHTTAVERFLSRHRR